jgi:hypothetical protein
LEYKTPKTQNTVLFTLLVLGAVSHFLKLFLAYNRGTVDGWRDVWFTTLASVCVITFPVHFFSKNEALKDSMFYLGVACGLAAFIYPSVPLKNAAFALQLPAVLFRQFDNFYGTSACGALENT